MSRHSITRILLGRDIDLQRHVEDKSERRTQLFKLQVQCRAWCRGSAGRQGEDQIETMRQKIRIIPSNVQEPPVLSVMREDDYAAGAAAADCVRR